jgi:hypothetical protein
VGTEIIEFIDRKPETERNRFYRLLNPQPEFYGLILNYEENLKQFPEFSDFDKVIHEDTVLSKHIDTLISGGMSGARMESYMYLFFIVDKLIVNYFLTGNKFDQELFYKLYCDLEYLFYHDDLPFKVIAPLRNFGSEKDTIDLGEGLIIRKITAEESKIFSRLADDLNMNCAKIA